MCAGRTEPVDSHPTGVSPTGAMNMAGNASEWVNDWFQYDYYATSPSSNPQGPSTGTMKTIRGGSFGSFPQHIRASFRSSAYSDQNSTNTGFRCAR
jgi:formylglycine-generating enzyme required for sulfatase activity